VTASGVRGVRVGGVLPDAAVDHAHGGTARIAAVLGSR